MFLQIHNVQLAHLTLNLLLSMSFAGISSISIDNDITGEPDIECLDQEIRVWVKTRKFFSGRIYAKGKSEDPECSKSNFGKEGTQKPHFDLPLGMCGMKSFRSFDPRGMYYGVTLVISFHPLFITKVDQAFHVKCFFEEASRGLTAELGVSMIPTTEVNARHNIMGCSYSIHRSSIADLDAGRAAGKAIQFAKVGDKVLHQWHCEDPMYKILIHTCYVTDGMNKKAQVIDEHGCPMDPILITGIRYSSDLQRAYAESQVFKFADRPGVWFFCQIQMCMKKDNMCHKTTPPACAMPTRGSIDENILFTGGEDAKNGEDNAVEGAAVTEVPPSDAESEIGDSESSPLNPSRIGTDKIPSDYESYTESNLNGPNRQKNNRKGSRENRPSAGDVLSDGYSPMENPSLSDYTNDEEDNSPSIFGPGLSPSASGSSIFSNNDVYASHDAAPKNFYDVGVKGNNAKNNAKNNNRSGNNEIVPPLSPEESSKLRPPPIHKSTLLPVESDGELKQEASLSFEANNDLNQHKGPPGNRDISTKRQNDLGIRTTIGGKPRIVTSTTFSVKRDYTDYDDTNSDDVEIPSNLANILAKLPSDAINAENLQRMFRDSVADRRALLSGFEALTQKIRNKKDNSDTATSSLIVSRDGDKGAPFSTTKTPHPAGEQYKPGTKIHTIHIDWNGNNKLARDSPLSFNDKNNQSVRPKRRMNGATDTLNTMTSLDIASHIKTPIEKKIPVIPHNGEMHAVPQMIAGQLLIYDLDETPPDESHLENNQRNDSYQKERDCALSKLGIFVLTSCLSSIIALLIIVVMALLIKIRRRMDSRDYY